MGHREGGRRRGSRVKRPWPSWGVLVVVVAATVTASVVVYGPRSEFLFEGNVLFAALASSAALAFTRPSSSPRLERCSCERSRGSVPAASESGSMSRAKGCWPRASRPARRDYRHAGYRRLPEPTPGSGRPRRARLSLLGSSSRLSVAEASAGPASPLPSALDRRCARVRPTGREAPGRGVFRGSGTIAL